MMAIERNPMLCHQYTGAFPDFHIGGLNEHCLGAVDSAHSIDFYTGIMQHNLPYKPVYCGILHKCVGTVEMLSSIRTKSYVNSIVGQCSK